ncbi:hypothetical protein OHC33_008113 [Knufia fluminis]|uniref:Major facilitator superfamily (MFS) profile domain-containing protein n=2 Tax=Knufia TaxID=430999 RepID=A0AAN8EJ33_9EURO|nr:hypothetical protein OHC33_008113 [Knufia fluminis]
MGRWRLYKTDRTREFDHERDRNVRARQIYETIDRQKFQYVVVLVAGVGFFLDGYTLFASNIVLPMISYVYWRDDLNSSRNTHINIATLAGTMIGQVVFGFLADKYGRKKMYGVELLLLITATLGVVMSSEGAEGSMSVFAWLLWWRVVVGIGVGADYPLSAVITSELSPTRHRATMMASVFFMQPLGQIFGNVVSLIVVAIHRNNDPENLTRSFDQMWRWIIGIGVLPGVIGVLFRVAIPETPRFLLDIEDDPIKAEFDATELFGDNISDTELEEAAWDVSARGSAVSGSRTDEAALTAQAEWTVGAVPTVTLNSNWTTSKRDIIQYFWKERNWITLAGTMLAWLLLDFAFYGIGISSPKFLAKTWGSLDIEGSTPFWKTSDDPAVSVFDMFFNTSVHALLILNLGSFIGGVLMISLASRINRVSLQKYGFLALAALFITLGTMFMTTHKEGAPAIVLYIIGQLFFNFGPNSTTYILPAELFPTRYRGTCHGLSAGAGKLGSILVQVFSTYYRLGSSTPGNAETVRYGKVLIVFSAIMILGAVVTHFMVPDVQVKGKGVRRIWGTKSKTLEELAVGRAGTNSDIVLRARRRRETD